MKRTVAIYLACFYMTATLATATPRLPATLVEIAEMTCPVQWAAYSAQRPDAWADYPPLEFDTSLDRTTTEAFFKYSSAVVALADFVSSFLGLSSAENQSPDGIERTKTALDLSTCLIPTPQERDLIAAFAQSQSGSSKEAVEAMLFEAFDQFECMGFERASALIFRLDPTSATFAQEFEAITSTTMENCQAN